MAEDTILQVMVSHHALLEALLSLFLDEAKEKSPRAAGSLSEFSWEIKKHFFTEENAIFDFVALRTFGVFETINHLKDEHLIMLIDLKNIADNLDEVKDEQIENFTNMLKNHREVEEKELYPKLDKELSPDQKRQIVARINEIPIHK